MSYSLLAWLIGFFLEAMFTLCIALAFTQQESDEFIRNDGYFRKPEESKQQDTQ